MKESRDILRNWRLTLVVFWLPALALVVTGFFNITVLWRAWVWAVALTIMGIACIINAIRCGRVHCYFTGPFLLSMAIVSLLYGFGHIAVFGDGWNLIALVTLIGLVGFWWIPEVFTGRYRTDRDLS